MERPHPGLPAAHRRNRLQARVARLGQYRNHRRRLDVEVYLPLP
jgi:hypothetical protein